MCDSVFEVSVWNVSSLRTSVNVCVPIPSSLRNSRYQSSQFLSPSTSSPFPPKRPKSNLPNCIASSISLSSEISKSSFKSSNVKSSYGYSANLSSIVVVEASHTADMFSSAYRANSSPVGTCQIFDQPSACYATHSSGVGVLKYSDGFSVFILIVLNFRLFTASSVFYSIDAKMFSAIFSDSNFVSFSSSSTLTPA